MSSGNIEYFSFNTGFSFAGHGGNQRLQQILEIFERNGFTYRLNVLPQSVRIRDKLKNLLLGTLPTPNAPISRFLRPRSLYYAGRFRTAIPRELIKGQHLFAFETFICGYSTNFERLRHAGSKIILLPDDLESLCPLNRHPFTNAVSPQWLKSEIAALAKGHVVCCISREEQWLLSLHGIPALYLRYYPPKELLQSLHQVRIKRQNAEEKNIVLVLGSATNPPTSLGLLALKSILHAIPKAFPGTEVAIVGFGTERHKQSLETEGVSVRGATRPEALQDLMVRSKCAIVSQVPSSGALTRIPDLLVAGIPIIANRHASRSYHNVDGVHTADSDDDIIELMHRVGPHDPKMPDPPSSQEALLVKAILDLSHSGRDADAGKR